VRSESLGHVVELSNREQEQVGPVENFRGQLCRPRDVAHGIFHIAIGLRPLGINRGAIDLGRFGLRLGGCLFGYPNPTMNLSRRALLFNWRTAKTG
jgi:hypothetical protein